MILNISKYDQDIPTQQVAVSGELSNQIMDWLHQIDHTMSHISTKAGMQKEPSVFVKKTQKYQINCKGST